MRPPGKAAFAVSIAVMAMLAAVAAAFGAGISRDRAAAIAKRAASHRVERFGISYPPRAWRAACNPRAAGGWRCAVGTNGQCSGVVTITGTSARPRVRKVEVSCFD